ncbi:uncharacterized protein Snoo [Eurosta solidaginis]|uniref:uncharacterized protein Snoo n=1 Tax=Eurosta solidaginis TaxID=178769 RepID=UPI003530B6FD
MTDYVTPNIHTVLKKYQTSAPKSLQGPGHTLTPAGCPTGSNCPLDATLSGVSGSGGSNSSDLSIAHTRNLCVGVLPPNGIAVGSNKLSTHCPLIATSASPACTNSPSSSSTLPPSGIALIKKEVLSSPEPTHELGETLVPQTLALPLSMSTQSTQQPQSQTTPPQQATLTTVKIIPPPPPELSQPIFTAPDSGSGVLYETRLEGKTIGCFSLGGEMRLCLPQFLNNVLADFTLDQINRIFDELGIYCSQCTPDQLLEFKNAKILPPDVKASGLITRTDAERLCAALLHRMDRNNYINDDDIPKGAISFKVYHRCFGKCDGICTPDLYSYNKPTCIMCLECKGWFSPQKFVGHVHRAVENRTCHWGFDSRNWHDYLHVALDVENREKYQKILDELKEVEIKEALKAQNELIYMKRKVALQMDDEMLASQLGHPLSGIVAPPHKHSLGLSDKPRAEMLDIPTKKAKGLDETAAYQLEYQRYQSLMYAHCAQQQRVGSMSAFRPWAPKSFLHPAATYNAVAAFSTLPYLSQEPPVLQNPERVVRSTDRERFERTYQPNVALVPRKCILAKEREKQQREFRERERIEREREVERIREQERKLERSLEREQTREREERVLEKERREREMQQQRQQQQQQTLQEQVAQATMCSAEVQIKQERANTPNEMPQSPPLTNNSGGGGDDDHSDRRSSGPMDEDTTLPMISPMSLTMSHQQKRKMSNNNQSGINCNSNSNSSSNHSDIDAMQLQQQQQQQQQQQVHDHHQQQQQQQQRRHSLYTSNSSACSTSSTTSTTPPQQQRLPAHLPPPQQYHQQQQTQQAQQQRHMQHLTTLQQQQARLRQSPRTFPPSPSDTHSSEELSGSNEITSSTSPAPCNETNKCTNRHDNASHRNNNNNHHSQTTTANRERQQQSQTLIATVNQHTKLLPTPISTTFTASNNSNNELPSRIRISKNLINRANIIRSPTPPPILPPTSALVQLHPQQTQQQMQILQHHQQQYEYYKQNQRIYDQQQQHQPLSSMQQHQHLIIRSQHHPSQQTQHSPSSSQSSTAAATGLNLSTHPTKAPNHTHPVEVQQNQRYRSYNGLPYVGSEFELSTDTDDDSVNGEADSSNILSPWDIAVDALRDTRPKDRERVLNLLRKLLHENQQMRYSNLQLSEMIHKRDIEIRELRDQLQTCRRHMEMLSLQQENPVQTNGLQQDENLNDEEMQEFALKKSVSSTEGHDMHKDYSGTAKETDINENGANARNPQTLTGDAHKERQFSDSEDEEEDPKRCEDDEESDAESENCEEAGNELQNEVALQESITEASRGRNDIKDSDISTQQPQAKRSRIDDSDGESADSSSRKSTTRKADDQTLHGTQTHHVNSSFDFDDDTPSCHTERTAMTNMGSECSNTKNNTYNNELGDDDEEAEDEEEEEATRFTVTNGNSSSDANISEDDDGVGCADGSRDENSILLTCTQVEQTDVQAPHNNALATPPTATSPLSPHSAATAGQLFDSSNSSDELSMKKAQMSASNALAKITDTADEVYEMSKLNRAPDVGQIDESCEEDQDSADMLETANSEDRNIVTQKEEYQASHGERYIAKSNLLLKKSHDAYNVTRDCNDGEDKFSNITSKSNNTTVEQIIRTPLATKASKKQTPTTNTELVIKKEII